MNNSSKRFSFLFTFLLMIVAMLVVSSLMNSKRGDEITYSEMRTLFLKNPRNLPMSPAGMLK